MKIAKGKRVAIDYTVRVGESVVDTTEGKKPLEYVHGSRGLLPAVQRELTGKTAGERVAFSLAPEAAYGPVREEALEQIAKSEFETEELREGMTLQEKQSDGKLKVGKIRKIGKNFVLMDFNHPMAGKTLKFEVKVIHIL